MHTSFETIEPPWSEERVDHVLRSYQAANDDLFELLLHNSARLDVARQVSHFVLERDRLSRLLETIS